MPKYPAGVSLPENSFPVNESTAFFSVTGMTCSACAGSVEKAIKRLPGIHEAVVDVLNAKARVQFYPSYVDVWISFLSLSLFTFFFSFSRAFFLFCKFCFDFRLVLLSLSCEL